MGRLETGSPTPHHSPSHSHSHYHLPPSPTYRHSHSSSYTSLHHIPTPYSGSPSPTPHHRQQIKSTWWCDSCRTDLTYRPRIRCAQCPNFDLCCNCYLLRAQPAPHSSWHAQQTVLPPPGQLRGAIKKNPNATFSCDASSGSASSSPTGSGTVITTQDSIGGSIENRHSPSHKMNVVTDNTPLTNEKLITGELFPTNLYLDLIDAIFTFIYKTYGIGTGDLAVAHEEMLLAKGLSSPERDEKEKRRSLVKVQPREHNVQFELLEAKKLAKFYKAMGMRDFENSYLLEPHLLARHYSLMGIEFYLVPSHSIRKKIADRTYPWQLEIHPSTMFPTMPTEPAMTRQGFLRSFVLGTLLNPSGTHYILQNVLNTGLVSDRAGIAYRGYVPRSCLPRDPVKEVLEWENGLGL